MGLWVRSQNKEILIPNPKLELEKIENEYWIVDLCDDIVLGIYKSKQRALEVLDEIQNNIENFCILKHTDNSFNEDNEYIGCHVYKMPKD